MGDGAALLDISHLPHTGYSIQHVGQSAARLGTATGAIQEAFQYPQIMMLGMRKLREYEVFPGIQTCVRSTSFLSSKEQKSDEKRMT